MVPSVSFPVHPPLRVTLFLILYPGPCLTTQRLLPTLRTLTWSVVPEPFSVPSRHHFQACNAPLRWSVMCLHPHQTTSFFRARVILHPASIPASGHSSSQILNWSLSIWKIRHIDLDKLTLKSPLEEMQSWAWGWWLTPVILATQVAEIRRIAVLSQPAQIVQETLS
jgi:hypothetical protein